MKQRKSQITRTIEYFREADIDEMRAAYHAVSGIVDSRLGEVEEPTRRTRGERTKGRGRINGAPATPNGAEHDDFNLAQPEGN